MSKIQFSVPLNEFTGINDLLKFIPDRIISHLEESGEKVLYHDPEGNDIEIKILAPMGEDWGDKEIRVEFHYSGVSI